MRFDNASFIGKEYINVSAVWALSLLNHLALFMLKFITDEIPSKGK